MSYVKLSERKTGMDPTLIIKSCVRLCLTNNSFLGLYDLVQELNKFLGNIKLENTEIIELLNTMPEVEYEELCGFYYLSDEDTTCKKFQTRIESSLRTACNENIRSILKGAPSIIIKAAESGKRSVVIAELTESEWINPIISKSVCAVLKKMYGITVFMRSEVDMGKAIMEKLPPFEEGDKQVTYYHQKFFLVAELKSEEDITRHRIACQEIKAALPKLNENGNTQITKSVHFDESTIEN